MFSAEIQNVLNRILKNIGIEAQNITFSIQVDGQELLPADFQLELLSEANGAVKIGGRRSGLGLLWSFELWQGGYKVSLKIHNEAGSVCSAVRSLVLDCQPTSEGIPLDKYWVPTLGLDVNHVGLFRVDELDEKNSSGSMMRGIFPDDKAPGLFLGTILPQRCLHLYTVARKDERTVSFAACTSFPAGLAEAAFLESEQTWLCGGKTLAAAIDQYAHHLPLRAAKSPCVGWNSWDYYFFTVSLEDVIENMEEILADARFAAKVKVIVVDAGWEHQDGEWQPNYKFPGGMERLAAEIRKRGFVPGIWSAAVFVHPFSKVAMRHYDLLIQDQYGDPQEIYGRYIVDPTHPAGEALIRDLYSRLYGAGFRFFKVDFVDSLLHAHRFHDPTKGPYQVLQRLFQIIRECVGDDSHILGCSLPQECGPGYCDSLRTGIDIHNQWTHVEWAVDYLQLGYWWHERIAVNDPDFIVVRGVDTSLEAETNVLNPKAHDPNPPRWRRGPVFTYEEAKTWATLVALSGGNAFLSDRIRTLNENGRALAAKVLEPTGQAARPLDLGANRRASIWLAEQEASYRLGIINWADHPKQWRFAFADYGLIAPKQVRDFWSEVNLPIEKGILKVDLPPHGSALFDWKGGK